MHTLFLDHPPPPNTPSITITGDEARHAIRVKRLGPGDTLRLLDGRGTILHATITTATRDLVVHIDERTTAEPLRPRLNVCSATPKGPRLDKMIDMLSQVGAAEWIATDCARSVVEPGEHKLDRLARIAHESAKQAARPWIMRTGERLTLAQVLNRAADAAHALVIADADGEPFVPTPASEITLLVGPEGGFTDAERQLARDRGATPACFGPHTMRVETAAVVGAAIILDAHRRHPMP